MSLGVAFALTAGQTEELLALTDDASRDEWLQDLEEEVEAEQWFQYDKAWDELHRCLGDGELVIQDGPPVAHVDESWLRERFDASAGPTTRRTADP